MNTQTLPPPKVEPQFDSPAQQLDAAQAGIWIFLATEVLFFGALFLAYTIYRIQYPAAFLQGSQNLKANLGALNTAVLLTSSLTMALAVQSAATNRQQSLKRYLQLTILLALCFLGIKFHEYSLEYHEGFLPGPHFHPDIPNPNPRLQLFFLFYFLTTALHALHVTAGIILLYHILRRATLNAYSSQNHNPIEIVGLYWHFVDVVWVFLFPILYLLIH